MRGLGEGKGRTLGKEREVGINGWFIGERVAVEADVMGGLREGRRTLGTWRESKIDAGYIVSLRSKFTRGIDASDASSLMRVFRAPTGKGLASSG